jgi:hypothetical protein
MTEGSEDTMPADRQAEIAASVAALQDLGPGYDQALAEGLVERIGAEIDKRIAAEIDNRVTSEVDSRILTQLDRYAGCRHQRRRAKRMLRAEQRMLRAERADRAGRQSIMLALGSMLVALSVTAIVLRGSPGVAAIMLMALIWVIVGIINVTHVLRKHPHQ